MDYVLTCIVDIFEELQIDCVNYKEKKCEQGGF